LSSSCSVIDPNLISPVADVVASVSAARQSAELAMNAFT